MKGWKLKDILGEVAWYSSSQRMGKHFEQFAIILMVHHSNILNYVMKI